MLNVECFLLNKGEGTRSFKENVEMLDCARFRHHGAGNNFPNPESQSLNLKSIPLSFLHDYGYEKRVVARKDIPSICCIVVWLAV